MTVIASYELPWPYILRPVRWKVQKIPVNTGTLCNVIIFLKFFVNAHKYIDSKHVNAYLKFCSILSYKSVARNIIQNKEVV